MGVSTNSSELEHQMHSYHAATSTLFQKLDREAVLLNLHTEQYFGLDPVGTRMWQVLAETNSLDKTVQTVLGEFEVDEARLRQDLAELVAKLVEKGLLVAKVVQPDGTLQ